MAGQLRDAPAIALGQPSFHLLIERVRHSNRDLSFKPHFVLYFPSRHKSSLKGCSEPRPTSEAVLSQHGGEASHAGKGTNAPAFVHLATSEKPLAIEKIERVKSGRVDLSGVYSIAAY